MNRLRFSPEALIDLDEIWAYIAEEKQNPAAAQSTVFNILDAIEKLRDFPDMGPSLSSITAVESDYRFLVCGNYLAFYRYSSNEVSIIRVLYSKRDYLRILFYHP